MGINSPLLLSSSPIFSVASSSSVILYVVIMIRLLVAIGALVVLVAVAEASSYRDDSYEYDKYEPQYYEENYYEPTYEKYDDEYDYKEPKYDHWPMYKYKSRYGYGGDSYGKSYSSYEDDHYRHKREAVGFEDLVELSPISVE